VRAELSVCPGAGKRLPSRQSFPLSSSDAGCPRRLPCLCWAPAARHLHRRTSRPSAACSTLRTCGLFAEAINPREGHNQKTWFFVEGQEEQSCFPCLVPLGEADRCSTSSGVARKERAAGAWVFLRRGRFYWKSLGVRARARLTSVFFGAINDKAGPRFRVVLDESNDAQDRPSSFTRGSTPPTTGAFRRRPHQSACRRDRHDPLIASAFWQITPAGE